MTLNPSFTTTISLFRRFETIFDPPHTLVSNVESTQLRMLAESNHQISEYMPVLDDLGSLFRSHGTSKNNLHLKAVIQLCQSPWMRLYPGLLLCQITDSMADLVYWIPLNLGGLAHEMGFLYIRRAVPG
jgi:hypothetical protein